MSIFQCEVCGCAENTSTGWYWSKDTESLNAPEELGIAKCSACASTHYPSGEKKSKFNGKWHGRWTRVFLPHGSCFTNSQGNIQHKETGLIGNELYKALGKSEEYPKP